MLVTEEVEAINDVLWQCAIRFQWRWKLIGCSLHSNLLTRVDGFSVMSCKIEMNAPKI
jgi:hypothetical protein